MKKWAVIIILALGVGAYIGYKMYNKPFDVMKDMKEDFSLTAEDLYNQFDANEDEANKKYLNKIILVSGKVQGTVVNDTGMTGLSLETGSPMGGIICEFDTKTDPVKQKYEPGTELQLKGICTGKLMDVVLSRCIVVPKKWFFKSLIFDLYHGFEWSNHLNFVPCLINFFDQNVLI